MPTMARKAINDLIKRERKRLLKHYEKYQEFGDKQDDQLTKLLGVLNELDEIERLNNAPSPTD